MERKNRCNSCGSQFVDRWGKYILSCYYYQSYYPNKGDMCPLYKKCGIRRRVSVRIGVFEGNYIKWKWYWKTKRFLKFNVIEYICHWKYYVRKWLGFWRPK